MKGIYKMRETELQNMDGQILLPKLLTSKEVAKLLGCSIKTLRTYCKYGGFPQIKFGRNVRFEAEKVFAWLRSGQYVR